MYNDYIFMSFPGAIFDKIWPVIRKLQKSECGRTYVIQSSWVFENYEKEFKVWTPSRSAVMELTER